MKRFVMDIPDELHQKLKVISALEGKSMKDVVLKLTADYVAKAEKRKLIMLPRK
jgi:plasmid stability protein